MKNNTYHILTATVIALTLSNLHVQAANPVDITINDGSASSTYGTDPRSGIGESGEVEANCVANASWDLRAMAFDINTKQLTIISGFNPLTANDGYTLGDIFINSSGALPVAPTHPNGYTTYPNIGYEFAIDITNPGTNNTSYNVVALAGDSVLKSGYYAQNYLSDPATLQALGSGSVMGSGSFAVATKSDAQVFSDLGISVGSNGGTNYVYSFDLTSILPALATGGKFHISETCGNDLLLGQLDASLVTVPEPGTWVMGLLVCGAVVYMVRRRTAAAI